MPALLKSLWQNRFDILQDASYVGVVISKRTKAGSSMKSYKIGIWLFLPAFIAFAIILPAVGPPAVIAETFIWIVRLIFLSILYLIAQKRICDASCVRVRPRSPPAV
jgi:hypothetical protein